MCFPPLLILSFPSFTRECVRSNTLHERITSDSIRFSNFSINGTGCVCVCVLLVTSALDAPIISICESIFVVRLSVNAWFAHALQNPFKHFPNSRTVNGTRTTYLLWDIPLLSIQKNQFPDWLIFSSIAYDAMIRCENPFKIIWILHIIQNKCEWKISNHLRTTFVDEW